jgi:glutamate racemase
VQASSFTNPSAPIGVFDSGVGGLTVLRALHSLLPGERFLYLGDTARLPYGTKSRDSVFRYSLQAAKFLTTCGIKYLVIACNTASAAALEALRTELAPMPVIGVIEPGAEAGCKASRTGRIMVAATEGTVQGGAYQRAIARLRPDATVVAQACSVFVALAEEGWTEGLIAEAVADRYLGEVVRADPLIDTLLLGCTHFPALTRTLRAVLGPSISIVDSAYTTASVLLADLRRRELCARHERGGDIRFLATDSPVRFARVGARILGTPLDPQQIELVDINDAR